MLNELKGLRKWIINNLHYSESKQEKSMLFFFIQMLNIVFMKSLQYKNVSFQEENEWRLFFKYPIMKEAECIYGEGSNKIVLSGEMLELAEETTERSCIE